MHRMSMLIALSAASVLLGSCSALERDASATATEGAGVKAADVKIRSGVFVKPLTAQAVVIRFVETDGCDALRKRLPYEAATFLVPLGPHRCGVSSANTEIRGGQAAIALPAKEASGKAVTFDVPAAAVEVYDLKG